MNLLCVMWYQFQLYVTTLHRMSNNFCIICRHTLACACLRVWHACMRTCVRVCVWGIVLTCMRTCMCAHVPQCVHACVRITVFLCSPSLTQTSTRRCACVHCTECQLCKVHSISSILKSDWGSDPSYALPLPVSQWGRLYPDPFSWQLLFERTGADSEGQIRHIGQQACVVCGDAVFESRLETREPWLEQR